MKKIILFAVVFVFLFAAVGTAFAEGKSGAAGKSNVGHLYLYEKDSNDPNWAIVPNGAWGKMKYNLSGPTFDFVFNGHVLEPSTSYTLIYYPDPWPGTGLICLGNAMSNEGGNVHIAGSVNTGSLPALSDWNNLSNPNHSVGGTVIDGAKIWLVLSSDVDFTARRMIGWNPNRYLFEKNRIFYTYVP
jgi:hypothetical protein